MRLPVRNRSLCCLVDHRHGSGAPWSVLLRGGARERFLRAMLKAFACRSRKRYHLAYVRWYANRGTWWGSSVVRCDQGAGIAR